MNQQKRQKAGWKDQGEKEIEQHKHCPHAVG